LTGGVRRGAALRMAQKPHVRPHSNISQPDRVCVTDITHVRTLVGRLYLAVVLDLFSRKVIGWTARQTIHSELVLDAMADISDYIDSFYNRTRRHQHLDGVSPDEFEAAFTPLNKRIH
jgi:transposase InsO family protein